MAERKKLHWFQRIIYAVNVVFALALALGFLIPFIPVDLAPKLSIFSLGVPALVIVNIIFILYWIIQFKRQWLLSFLILLLGYAKVMSVYKFGGTSHLVTTSAIKVMTYNVRIFNKYQWIDEEGVKDRIVDMIRTEEPDVLCLQEFHEDEEGSFDQYPFRYVKYKSGPTGQVIFSKYPIVGEGSLEFPESGNNAIYADLLVRGDTLRVYNVHLQSFMINPEEEELSQENSNRIANRMSRAFLKQKEQADIFRTHRDASPYHVITCGDLNNTQFSGIYKQVKGDDVDSFDAEGQGTGKTYYFRYFPLRIDFIFADERLQVVSHKNRYEFFSDHYPVISQVKVPF